MLKEIGVNMLVMNETKYKIYRVFVLKSTLVFCLFFESSLHAV